MSFADVIGNEPAVRLLKGQIARDRLAHTYLFVGPEGIGKRALAVEFARALHCEKPSGEEACGQCEPCRKIAEGKHPDLLIIGAESEKSGDIGIDQVRTMEGWMSLTPFSGKLKVAVLDPADRLTDESMHACLKILEEPPARSIFILIASAAHRLPATLLSRCHRVRCSPQGIERTAAHLQEKEKLDPAQARMLAICSGGRLGMALQFHRTGRLTARNEALDLILDARRKKELESPLAKASREEIREYVEWYAGWWRDLMVLSVGGDPAWVIHQDRLEELKKIVVPLDRIFSQVDRAVRVSDAVNKNASVKTALSVLLGSG